MPCRQSPTDNGLIGSGPPSGGGYRTEAECLAACQEGACCESAGCAVKPQCQCKGAGKFFQGVGTTCSPDPCLVCGCITRSLAPQTLYARFSGFSFTYRDSSGLIRPPRPPDPETAVAGWLNTIVAEIPLTGVTTTLGNNFVSYNTRGCVADMVGGVLQPCQNCSPPFRADLGNFDADGMGIQFFCNGIIRLPRFFDDLSGLGVLQYWILGPAVGCEPAGLDSRWITSIQINFRSPTLPSWCSIAQGLTPSPVMTAHSSRMTMRYNLSSVDVVHFSTGSGGTVTISTNPLP